jgi:hypothetical protein
MMMGRFAESEGASRECPASAFEISACDPTPAATAPSTDVFTKSRREKVTDTPWIVDLRTKAEGYHGMVDGFTPDSVP